MKKPTIIVTSIQPPSDCMRQWSEVATSQGYDILVVGDKKGPIDYPLAGTELLSFLKQTELPFRLAPLLPVGHYARKNLGYLMAMYRQAPYVFETDDDNAPMESWRTRECDVVADEVESSTWCNVYRLFSDEVIWPRGLPLNAIYSPVKVCRASNLKRSSPIQQVLVDRAPDVDAIWRLLNQKEVNFRSPAPSVALPPGVWCPFNSQATWWWPKVYPLMYLPSFCSFRMTDIWRSFVAQRCLWALGHSLVFHSADVYQIRNDHNLMRDFSDEVPGYLKNWAIADILIALDLTGKSASEGLFLCYEALVSQGIFEKRELTLVESWIADCVACQ